MKLKKSFLILCLLLNSYIFNPIFLKAAENNSIDQLKKQTDDTYVLEEGIQTIKQSDALVYDTTLQMNAIQKNAKGEMKPFAVFSDAAMNIEYPIHYETRNNQMIIGPEKNSGFRVLSSGDNQLKKTLNIVGYDGWGLMPIYYLVQYNDLNSGKLLSKPIVRRLQIQKDEFLDTPRDIQYQVQNDGTLEITWQPVKNAAKYYIALFNNVDHSETISFAPKIIGMTSETKWNSNQAHDASSAYINKSLVDFNISEDALSNESERTRFMEMRIMRSAKQRQLAVIAVDEEGQTSKFSDLKDAETLFRSIPLTIASNALSQMKLKDKETRGYEDIPTLLPVTMADGSTRMLTTRVDIDSARISNQTYLNFDLYIENSDLKWNYSINSFNADSYKDQLKDFNAKNTVSTKVGFAQANYKYTGFDTNIKAANTYPDTVMQVMGYSSLGKYIAANMMNGENYIDVSAFSEADDQSVLSSAYNQAVRYNPIIPPVKSFYYAKSLKILQINYYIETKDERMEYIHRINKKADQVVKDIINDHMNDKEKVTAINNWICDNVSYSTEISDLLKQKPNFITTNVDNIKYFEADGVFDDGVAVCSGYAEAFSILALKSGLLSIVQIGDVAGSRYGHEWNIVKIDDRWLSVDTTWNDTEGKGNNRHKYLLIPEDDAIMTERHIAADDPDKDRLILER